MSRITFFSSDPECHRFIQPIIDRLALEGHECQLLNNWTITDADCYWFDFCDNNLISATTENKEALKNKKVIARLHAVEYYMGYHTQIDWSSVSDLIFVSDHLRRMCGDLPVRTHVIHNGIDLDKLEFRERDNEGFILGYAGNIVTTKGMTLVPGYLRELQRYDGRWKLKMVGLSRLSGREGEYFNHATKDLGVEMADGVSDINAWLEGIDYLWQPSLAESFSMIVGEAMAKGIKPIINDFYGSRELWPEELIYNDFTSFFNIINAPYDSQKYREFVERYSINNEMEQIKKLL